MIGRGAHGMFCAVSILAGLTLAGAAGTREPGPLDTPFSAVSRPSDHRELAFPTRGRVAELMVKPGDALRKGDPIMRLEDATQRLTLDLYKNQAQDNSPVEAAENSLAFREAELKLTQEASANAGANPRDLRAAVYDRDQARIKLESVRVEHAAAQIQVARQQAELDQMLVTSPTECVVLDIAKRPGESTDEQTPVCTVVTIDPLWMDVNVPTPVAMALSLGQSAEVTWEDLSGAEPAAGRVIFISPSGHGGSRQVQVRLEIPNPKKLPSGLHAGVRFRVAAGDPG
ncbi:MAG: efflux RND transporter periplasmic adaptor subunit [Phycisphaerales bacterium]|nr:efflux RND transporter periplasmic adaptor subunit [Phycisphaerales bacterium]